MTSTFESGLRAILEREGVKRVEYVTPVSPAAADGLLAETYDQLRTEYLVAPPFTLHSPAPGVFAGAWSVFRESLLVGAVPRTVKESVATAVSASNRCPYCVESHALSVRAGAGNEVAEAIESGEYDAIVDPQVRAAARWAAATRSPDADVVLDPPFTRDGAPEIVGTALTFHYLNRMVNVFCAESPLPMPSTLDGLRGLGHRMAAPIVRGVIDRSPAPGESLTLVPRADTPDDLAWASGNPTIERAFAGFVAIAEETAREELPAAVLDVVREEIAAWNGEEPAFGRDWLDGPTESIEERDRPSARLAIATALASYRVDDALVDDFRRAHPGDRPLVVLTSWASLTAARRIGTWLHVPEGDSDRDA